MNVKETSNDYSVRTNWDKVLDQARAVQREFLMNDVSAGIIKNEKMLEVRVVVELERLSIPGVEDLVKTNELTLKYDLQKNCILCCESYENLN